MDLILLLKTDSQEEMFFRWTHCQLTNEKLEQPVICDEFGNLFNKGAVIKVCYVHYL